MYDNGVLIAYKLHRPWPMFHIGIPREGSELTFGDKVLHHTHSLAWRSGVVFCWRCAAWARTSPRNLANPCGSVKTQGGKEVLRRLQRGLYPITAMTEWPSNEAVPPMITDIDGTLDKPDERVNVL